MTDAEPISEATWAHLKEMGVTFSLTGPDADAALAEIERLRNERAEALVECLHRGQEIKRLRSQPNEGPILTALLRDYAHWLNNKGYADFHRLEGTWNEFLAAERAQQATTSEQGCWCRCVESCAVDCTAECACQSAQEAASAP